MCLMKIIFSFFFILRAVIYYILSILSYIFLTYIIVCMVYNRSDEKNGLGLTLGQTNWRPHTPKSLW